MIRGTFSNTAANFFSQYAFEVRHIKLFKAFPLYSLYAIVIVVVLNLCFAWQRRNNSYRNTYKPLLCE